MAAFSEYIDSNGDKYLSGVFTVRNISPTSLIITKGWVINHQDNPSSYGSCFYGYPFDIEEGRQVYLNTYQSQWSSHEIPYYQSLAYKPNDYNYKLSKSFTLREYDVHGDEFLFTISFKPKRIGQYLAILTIVYESNGITKDFTASFNGGLINGILSINHVTFDGDTANVDGVDPFSIFRIS